MLTMMVSPERVGGPFLLSGRTIAPQAKGQAAKGTDMPRKIVNL
jgi:hypothetical protein